MSNKDDQVILEDFMKLWQEQCNQYAKDPESAKAMFDMFVEGQKLQQHYFSQFFQNMQEGSDDQDTDTPSSDDDLSQSPADELLRLWKRIARLEERVAELESKLAS